MIASAETAPFVPQPPSSNSYDVLIIGGGPGGSTAATLLRKYDPRLRVLVLEKEVFPRDHIGESQLPSISAVLDEMGAWEKVEAAGFPIKLGASYTWGRDADQWDFDFYPVEEWKDEPRPAKFEGQRRFTAFQVDRAIYDELLLDHAAEQGAEVREGTLVREVLVEGGRVAGVRLESGQTITARYYIDASGSVGLLRRALDVPVKVTDELKNIAVWDYWQNAEWADKIGVGGTRVQVRSLPYGWIWFIPLGPTRTSIGLITPAEHFKKTGKTPEELYLEALASQEQIARLTRSAQREMKLQATKDWSQLAERIVGDNWFLVGEAAGFADPILAAGMSLTHSSARDAAYTILELDRGELDGQWLRRRYNERNRTNIEQHIRFGQYWYSANGCFTDLQEHCSRIADSAGLKLDPKKAWAWLAQGGFISESLGLPSLGSFDLASAKHLLERFDRTGKRAVGSMISGYNVFKLNLRNAERNKIGMLKDGRITPVDCYERGEAKLPLTDVYGAVVSVLERTDDGEQIIEAFMRIAQRSAHGGGAELHFSLLVQALDIMIEHYWVMRDVDKRKPLAKVSLDGARSIRSRSQTEAALAAAGQDPRGG
ncbi:MAG: NAD(P)/FAD-dependent oxidoreductase [Planctomycetota bacterium]|nr:NAD(P)/FAD-dependent oxidoreductase [Planctomycetota bacterium]